MNNKEVKLVAKVVKRKEKGKYIRVEGRYLSIKNRPEAYEASFVIYCIEAANRY